MKGVLENHFRGNHRTFYKKYLPEVKHAGGQEYKAVCTFHEEGNASFYFNDEKGAYYCQGCGKKGHIFHFYAKLHGLAVTVSI